LENLSLGQIIVWTQKNCDDINNVGTQTTTNTRKQAMFSALDTTNIPADTSDDHAEFNARFEAMRQATGPHLPLSLEVEPRRTFLDCAVPLAVAVLIVACIAWGYIFGRLSVQSANDLTAAGFTIIDPDGCEVAQFNDGAAAVADYFANVLTANEVK